MRGWIEGLRANGGCSYYMNEIQYAPPNKYVRVKCPLLLTALTDRNGTEPVERVVNALQRN